MTQVPAQGYFYPYDSIDELYAEKCPPEFGRIRSLWELDLPKWRFFHAREKSSIPQNWTSVDFDDTSWAQIDVPSCWQQQGYGYPSELVYEKNALLSKKTSKIQKRLADSAIMESLNDVGLYRVWVNLPAEFISRFVYLMTDGIVGRYQIFVNGTEVSVSRSTFSATKCLLNGTLTEGANLISILVMRYDVSKHGNVRAQGAFGFSGLFRLPYIVAEPSVEISAIRLSTSWLTDTLARDVVPKTALVSSLYRSDNENQLTDRQKETLPHSDIRKDAGIGVQVEIHNHLPYDMPVSVSCRLVEAHDEYDLYNLPEHRLSQRKELAEIVPKEGIKTLETECYAKLVLPWTDQTPFLYDFIVELKDRSGEVICVKKQRFGFRTLTYSENLFNINDLAEPLHGVKYYEFDPEEGISVPIERYRQDILLMKCANINTIYVVHHPTNSVFFDLCDKYGMYVIVQSAASVLPQTVYSLYNHPSIIMWSMTGKKFEENAYMNVKERIISFDAKRPIYCEIDPVGHVSDLPRFPNKAGMFFGEWCDLCLNRASLKSRLKEDKVLFESISMRPRREEDTMDLKYIHQGDLVEYSEQVGISIAQGIVDANRVPHPIFYEVKKQCEGIKIFPSAEQAAKLTIHNVHSIGSTPEIELKWQILLGGIRLTGGSGIVPPIAPLGNREMQFAIEINEFLTPKWKERYPKAVEIYERAACKELILDISMTLAKDTFYAHSGYEVAFYQQILVDEVCDPSEEIPVWESEEGESSVQIIDASSVTHALIAEDEQKPSVSIMSSPAFLFVIAGNVRYGFSRKEGGLCSVMSDGKEYFNGLFEPNFYRSASNIDRADQSFVLSQTIFSHETDWRTIESEMRFVGSFYEMDGDDFHLICKYASNGMKGPLYVRYRIRPDGTLLATLDFTPKYDLVRYGFRVPIDQDVYLGWYGRGEGESYVDRKESARIGWFTSLNCSLFHEYARPSESGAHADTKYLQLQHDDAKGIQIRKNGHAEFSFSCLPYSPEDIDDCSHQELLQSDGRIHLYLDFYMKGIERSPDVLTRRGLQKNVRYEETIEIAPKY